MALLLALVALEPLRGHACPRHEGASPSTAVAGDAADHAHAGHAGHDAGSRTAPAGGDGGDCDCLGDCGLATVAGLPAGIEAVRLAAERAIAAAPAATSPTTVALARERLLPFANGPPARG